MIRPSRVDEGEQIVAIWRAAVDATHQFLKLDDRRAIDEMVRDFLPSAPLLVATDHGDRPLGFMLLDGSHMEALFIHPKFHGSGLGAALVEHALDLHPNLTTDVNEQNDAALAFYERLGFQRIGRSPVDRQGRNYPLIHLAHCAANS